MSSSFQRRILRNSAGIRCHDFTDLAALLTNKIRRILACSEQEFQPSHPPALRTDFGAANKIALRNDADQLFCGVDHREPADVLSEQDFGAAVGAIICSQHISIIYKVLDLDHSRFAISDPCMHIGA